MKGELLSEYGKAGGDVHSLNNPDVNHLVVNSNKVLSSNKTPEIEFKAKEERNGVALNLVVKDGVSVREPVHLCFGILEKEKVQNIKIRMVFGRNSSASILAHCIFPNASKVVHKMLARIVLKEGSSMEYSETHYHGTTGSILVAPKAEIFAGKNSVYLNKFSLLKGKAGTVNFDYAVHLGSNAKCEMLARVNADGNDKVNVLEKAFLDGNDSNALLNTRIVLAGKSKGYVENTIIGEGANSRGHMDCIEVINGEKATAKAVPIVEVKNKTSKVTHEAAIGSIDKASLNTLMSRGLTQEEAVKVIINGILK